MRNLSYTPSGIPAVGAIPWGSHFCHFYSTAEDLADSLVPYFKAGLEHNEQCLWITSEPFGVEDAKAALRTALPRLESYLQEGRIDILDYREWYRRSAQHDIEGILQGWLEHKERALARGRTGLRLTGNTFWLEAKDWQGFIEYENRVNEVFREHEIIAQCSYCLHRCEPEGILDVVRNHQFAVARRAGEWEVVESCSLKQAKQALHQLNLELEHRVVERTAELEAALRARDEFLSMASHELKTPLTALKLQLDMVKAAVARGEGELAQQLVPKLRTLERQVARLGSLSGSLLDVTLLGSGRLHLEPQPVDLPLLVREAVERLGPELASSGSQVHLEVRGNPQGEWDPQRVDQIVVNLLSNAAKYGEGRPIHVRVEQRGGQVLLSVRDEGIGITPEAQARLFRKFERAVPARHYGGLGLGLYISRMLAQVMGGSIEVESQLGQGSTFTVSLPLQPGRS